MGIGKSQGVSAHDEIEGPAIARHDSKSRVVILSDETPNQNNTELSILTK